MAKSSRSSTRKANNQRLKANVFGPVESARAERLSAKLLEIAAQPKPAQDDGDVKIVDNVDAAQDDETKAATGETAEAAAMEVDSAKPSASSSSKKNRVSKRRKTSKIVFPKYKDRRTSKKGKN
ncbi:hypothetical protein Micbo1qcDRAFT_191991 [Microdochium bolleyi]|uniref:DUF2423 domain-containing protein n=1 Tax=Microdochium bolleyi TaxID=196109 RepID=A0A136JK68_9PEZI|nr:hypothetical protein Micbo1qcDRAFT_191991 [Microdochium bolleyi]